MDYQKIYDALIERAHFRILDGYTETHHIIPKCMKGDNSKENLVSLTPEEHYLAHQLLVKIYPNNRKLIFAAMIMTGGCNGHRSKNKLYGWLRRLASNAVKGVPLSAEHRRKIGEANKGNIPANKGKPISDEHKKALSEANRGNPGRRLPCADSTRLKISEANSGKVRSEEAKQRYSAAKRE